MADDQNANMPKITTVEETGLKEPANQGPLDQARDEQKQVTQPDDDE
ncbi:hypothetical protein [Sphingomonas sp.]|nr:hypothetical protein [Sphingomonas sp.]